MYILAVDTSCDETSVAITKDDVILANVIASQVQLHKKWGGVVPAIAQRAHKEQIDPAIAEALHRAKFKLTDIDVFAVTYGPGLAIALEVGINKIKQLAKQYKKPVLAVNHMVGHIYANFARTRSGKPAIDISALEYPALALLVSGGHTQLVLIRSLTNLEIIGQTLDDAMGEAYDKVAKMLGLGYPGGPIIARLAKEGNPFAYDFPVPMKDSKDLNFSFSGLKTAVLYAIKKLEPSSLSFPTGQRQDRESSLSQGQRLDPRSETLALSVKDDKMALTRNQIIDIAASFQRVAFESVILKLKAAVDQYGMKQVLLGGGVIANTDFRKAVRDALRPYGVKVHYPNLKKLCTDNAAMIAVAAYHQAKKGDFVKDLTALDRDPTLHI